LPRLTSLGVSFDNNYDTFPVRNSGSGSVDLTNITVDLVVEDQLIHGHIFKVGNPMDHFSFTTGLNGCPGMIRTAISAQGKKCIAATNAGYFDMNTGACLGTLVEDSQVIQLGSDPVPRATFGMLSSGEYISGYFPSSSVADMKPITMIQGQLWIVRNGTSYVDASAKIEGASFDELNLKAPRTAVGYDAAGSLMILTVDGSEYLMKGVTMYGLAEVALAYGIVDLINLDGGGSTTAVYNGALINTPSDTCPNGVGTCSRLVTSIACVRA